MKVVAHERERRRCASTSCAATDIFGNRLTPPGFYYKTFIRPRRLWPLYEKVLRNAAGLGRLARRQARARVAHRVPAPPCRRARDRRRRRRHEPPRCAPPSWGPTWCSPTTARSSAGRCLPATAPSHARELGAPRPRRRGRGAGARRGARLLRRHRPRLGREHPAPGARRPPHRRHRLDRAAADVRGQRPARGDAVLRRAAARLRSTACDRASRRSSRPRPTAASKSALALARSRRRDRRRRRRPSRAAPAGTSRRGSSAARIPLLRGQRAWSARSAAGRVRGAVVAELDAAGTLRSPTPSSELDCDLIAVSGGTCPPTSLLLQAGGKARWDAAARRLPARTRLPPGIHGAGRGRRPRVRASSAELSGAVAGAEAALSLELGDDGRPGPPRGRARGARRGAEPATEIVPAGPPATERGRGEVLRLPLRGRDHRRHQLRDRRGLRLARAAEALHDGDHGPVPGPDVPAGLDPADRRATPATAVADVGLTTARPPWSTVPMGALAGRPFEPAKRSAVHGRHRELGGNVLWAGDWRRPYDYGDPEGRDDGRARGRRA